MTANGKLFYYDYQNSMYGYNTDSARGADTFHPFSNLIYMEANYEASLSITVPSGTRYVRFCPTGEDKLSNLLKVGESQSITGSNGVVSTLTFTNSTTVTLTRTQSVGWVVIAFFK